MAGKYNPSTSASDFLTPFALFRVVGLDDVSVDGVSQILDMTQATSARHNTLMLLVTEATDLTDTINIGLYCNFPDAPAAIRNEWYIYHDAIPAITPGLVYVYDNLIACRYKLFVTRANINGQYSIYASTNVHTGLKHS